MKDFKTKNLTKQIICIIIVLMLCNFIIPNISYAADNDGGTVFAPFSKFITYLCDSLMQFLQETFTSNENIAVGDGTYNFQYSPGIIFSGKVLPLDINFIKPNTDVRNTNNFEAFLSTMQRTYYNEVINDGNTNKSKKEYQDYFEKAKSHKGNREISFSNFSGLFSGSSTIVYYEEIRGEKNFLCVEYFVKTSGSGMGALNKGYNYKLYEYEINTKTLEEMNAISTYSSIANDLQPTIATWYNALRRIALVGLLSVLVYVGIRILLCSINSKDNSKYKKMLTDWLIALCLLFTLHYIMSVTLLIADKLSSIFTTGETDVLLNTLRAQINEGSTWGEVVSQVVMYVVLVIFTIMFTFQYLKRVLYMAFFTMIAPLITLTYPIDKIGDGKAQAFNMWIREYIFNALIQVVHLVIYFVLVGSAIELVKIFPLYGVIAIGFMTQAEKLIRKMFGFDNATTVGTIGAAATGGLIMSAMNKLKALPKGSKDGKDKSAAPANKGSNKVRMASNKPATSTGGVNNSGNSGSMTNTRTTTSAGTANSGTQGVGTNTSTTVGAQGNSTNGNLQPQRNIKGGAGAVSGRYFRKIGVGTIKAVGRGFVGATGTMVGLAAGVAQGDMEKAFGGLAGGAVAGYHLAKNLETQIPKIGNTIKETLTDVKDTWNEGENAE